MAIGVGTGAYSTSLTGLEPGTTYYIKAYAFNSARISYGAEESFTSLVALPTLITELINTVTLSTAESGGNITDDGGGTITERGVCWSPTTGPIVSDSKTSDGSGTGSFTSSITGLSSNTTIYVRAFATNSAGTAYGEEYILKTMTGTLTDYDGNTYYTVTIGSQVWMAENLKTTSYADGTSIPLVEITATWDALASTDKAYSFYDNSAANGTTYGALYTWAAAMNGANSSSANPSNIQGVCPSGWHLPSDDEWTDLVNYLGGSSGAGGKMKETGTNLWLTPNVGATNESGFTGLPGGYRIHTGVFGLIKYYSYLWSSTENDGTSSWYRYLYYNNADVGRTYDSKERGKSVRCIEGTGYTIPTITTSIATDIASTSATVGGEVTDDGGDAVTDRGIYLVHLLTLKLQEQNL